MHSGTGRFSFLDMRPMSLYESGESTGQVSLRALFDGGEIRGLSDSSLEDVTYAICRGGWPAAVTEGGEPALETAYDHVAAVAEGDISRADGMRRNAEYARLVMAAYARCTATMADIETVRRNIRTQRGEIARKVDHDINGAPFFLAVIVPSGYACRRDGGIYVVPITCLKP